MRLLAAPAGRSVVGGVCVVCGGVGGVFLYRVSEASSREDKIDYWTVLCDPGSMYQQQQVLYIKNRRIPSAGVYSRD